VSAPTPVAPLSPAETTELRYLELKKLQFQRHGAILRLIIENEGCWLKVSVVRIFPLSGPQRHLSVRDGANKEVGIIVDPDELDAENRRLVAEELERRYLVPVVRRIIAVKERFGTVEWEVETDRGISKFTMRNVRENVLQPSPERYLFSDVEGNRYDGRDLTALDAASQALVMRYL
jgi:hypothetical protein